MSFSIRQMIYHVKDAVLKQKYLTMAFGIWLFLCCWWSASNIKEIFDFYQISSCVADLLIRQQGSLYTGIMIFPITLILMTKYKQNSLNIQCLLRYGSRERMLRSQIAESTVYSVSVSLLLLLMQCILGRTQVHSFINWDSMDSYYYLQTGETASVGFWLVLTGIFLMYVIKFLLLLIILDLLMWYQKYLFAVWIIAVLFAAVGIFSKFRIFHEFFAFDMTSWTRPWNFGLRFLLGIAIAAILYILGGLLIRRKDLFH